MSNKFQKSIIALILCWLIGVLFSGQIDPMRWHPFGRGTLCLIAIIWILSIYDDE